MQERRLHDFQSPDYTDVYTGHYIHSSGQLYLLYLAVLLCTSLVAPVLFCRLQIAISRMYITFDDPSETEGFRYTPVIAPNLYIWC